MAKTLGIGLILIIIAGIAYYFGTMQPQTSPEGSTATSTSEAGSGEHAEVNPLMEGTWTSEEDTNFTREFKADGTMTDRYDGDESATETATFVTIDPAIIEVPGVPAANLTGVSVIRVDFASGPMFFSINTLTETELAMTNLSGRGNILRFTK